MSQSNRRRQLAARGLLIGLLFVGPALAQQGADPAFKSEPVPETRQQPSTPNSNETTSDQPKDTGPIATAIKQLESAIRELVAAQNKPEDKGKEEREIEDLQAQKEMALWAKCMLWAAVASLLLTAAGVFLIWRTLLYTRTAAVAAKDAVEEARHATKAAQESVQVARFAAERQLRPYLNFTEGSISCYIDKTTFWTRSEVIFKHSGATHAIVKNSIISNFFFPKGQFANATLGEASGQRQLVQNGAEITFAVYGGLPTSTYGIQKGPIFVGVKLQYIGWAGLVWDEETWLVANVHDVTEDRVTFPLRYVERPAIFDDSALPFDAV